MDPVIAAAGRALAAGDPLGALKRVALRDDAPALALRAIAMAQLGDLVRAKALLRRAARAFPAREAVARARCVVAEAEIAFASRDLGWSAEALDAARATLEAHGDSVNAAHARYLDARRQLMLGRVDDAERALAELDVERLPPSLRSLSELVAAGIAIRRLRPVVAQAAFERAERSARQARIPALLAEVEGAARVLREPAARLLERGAEHVVGLEEVATVLTSSAFVVDGLRNTVQADDREISFATRPVLFALARALAEGWPGDVSRATLIARAFGSKMTDDSHRARLRVEVARLRSALRPIADVSATKEGFVLAPRASHRIVVLARPSDEDHAAVLALLSDGEAWSSSALALALGTSQRTVQRALDALASAGRVQSFGRGRSRRWIAPPVPGFTTLLLLPDTRPIA